MQFILRTIGFAFDLLRTHPRLGIILALAVIYLSYASGETVLCGVHFIDHPSSFQVSHQTDWKACAQNHLLFPLFLFSH